MAKAVMALPGAPKVGDNKTPGRRETLSASTSRKQAARKSTGGLAALVQLDVQHSSDEFIVPWASPPNDTTFKQPPPNNSVTE
ncbi:hypothetical protein FRC06_000171 [Ceratobasidium sp. 370]|nr:hypothetical protein FRC06_000171 [Ceratobasidium sp. 370]